MILPTDSVICRGGFELSTVGLTAGVGYRACKVSLLFGTPLDAAKPSIPRAFR